MDSFLIKGLQLILSLSILVIVHEFGHFIFARIFKIRVEKFYLFFDPWFSLFKFKPKGSDTEYGIGWLPLGGYVKISGMIDESMDKEQMAQPVREWEFRAKPAWQRLLVMTAGVIFNFILAMFIYSMVLFHWGDTYIPLKNVTQGMEFSDPALKMGFQDGDILLKADTIQFQRLDDKTILQIANAKKVTVLRNNSEVSIAIPDTFMTSLIAAKKGFCTYRVFTVVDSLKADSPAMKAGLQKGDSIVAINDEATPTFVKFSKAIADKKNETVKLTFFRSGVEQSLDITTTEDAKLGFGIVNRINPVKVEYGFLQCIPAGIHLGVETLSGYVGQLKYVFTKEGASSIGGFGTLGGLFPSELDSQIFWLRTAFLSVVLAFMNILPIPMLDGGHVMFLLYEVITGRTPNEKFQEKATIAGLVLLVVVLLYANGSDVVRFIQSLSH